MASHPDTNPDSIPSGPSDSPEQVTPSDDPGRESVEDSPEQSGGTASSGGENEPQDAGGEYMSLMAGVTHASA